MTTRHFQQGYPIWPITLPSAIACDPNGALPASRLAPIGHGGRLEATKAAPAWSALWVAAQSEGFDLTWTPAGDYRSLETQERGFYSRTRPIPTPDGNQYRDRFYAGGWYEDIPGTAQVATPGTSNHGNALAIDTALGRSPAEALHIGTVAPNGRTALSWLRAPAPAEWQPSGPGGALCNAETFGFCWEPAPAGRAVEPWHLNYYAGDATPARVTAVLAFVGAA